MIDGVKDIFEILGAAVIFFTSVIALWVNLNKSRKQVRDLKEENKELKKKYESSSMYIDLADLNGINSIVNADVFSKTLIDRFLLLSGVNGKDAFNFVSALYEQHKDGDKAILSVGATSKYVDVRTDPHYKMMLVYAEKQGPVYGKVSEMPECKLKDFYISEEILSYAVLFITRISLDKENDRLVFISFASHETEDITVDMKVRIESSTSKIKHLLEK